MIEKISVSSARKTQLIDITDKVLSAVKKSAVTDGICFIHVPHTTAAVIINENADPAVQDDILKETAKIAPQNDNYTHTEGNSAAHIKSALIGSGRYFFIENKTAQLGRWQGIFFCEFDGPRNRTVLIKIIQAGKTWK